MEQMSQQPQPLEGDEATTGTMSPLTAVRQYLSTNSAKSTFLRNSGLVVKVTSSKSPSEQNLPARQSDISMLQTQVQSLIETFVKQGQPLFDVVKICMVLKPDYRTFSMSFRSLGEMKVKVMVLHRTIQHET